jgi:hypothetical protein
MPNEPILLDGVFGWMINDPLHPLKLNVPAIWPLPR